MSAPGLPGKGPNGGRTHRCAPTKIRRRADLRPRTRRGGPMCPPQNPLVRDQTGGAHIGAPLQRDVDKGTVHGFPPIQRYVLGMRFMDLSQSKDTLLGARFMDFRPYKNTLVRVRPMKFPQRTRQREPGTVGSCSDSHPHGSVGADRCVRPKTPWCGTKRGRTHRCAPTKVRCQGRGSWISAHTKIRW